MSDLDRLAELARAATGHEGRWEALANPHGDSHLLCRVDDEMGCFGETWGWCREEAAYIAAASPDVILALVERVKRYEAAIDTVLVGEESGAGGWGPDVTMASILRTAREGS